MTKKKTSASSTRRTWLWSSGGRLVFGVAQRPCLNELRAEARQQLRAWLAEHGAEVRDRQFQAEVNAGRLDAIGDRALNDFAENRGTDR